MANKGHFITLEGGEGVGKSTQAKILADRLAECGVSTLLTREPGGSPGAEEIRKLLVTGGTDKWQPITETLLLNAARADHLHKVILPALAAGKWVICDRYADSTLAYQGQAIDRKTLLDLHRIATDDVWPDLTLILDGHEVERAQSRENSTNEADREDRFERMGQAFHENLREEFLKIAADHPERCVLLSASGSIEEISGHIWQVVSDRLHPGDK